MRFWFKETNTELLNTTRKNQSSLDLLQSSYFPQLVYGDISSKDELMARTKHPNWVHGKVRPWDAVRDPRCLYVLVEPTQLTTGPLYLTGYSGINVSFHKHKRTIDNKIKGAERSELLQGENFVMSAFNTFDFFFKQRGKTGYSPQLLLYDSDGQLDSTGNMANLTRPEQLEEAMAKKREMISDTETSRWPLP